jgi:hypothetical protein
MDVTFEQTLVLHPDGTDTAYIYVLIYNVGSKGGTKLMPKKCQVGICTHRPPPPADVCAPDLGATLAVAGAGGASVAATNVSISPSSPPLTFLCLRLSVPFCLAPWPLDFEPTALVFPRCCPRRLFSLIWNSLIPLSLDTDWVECCCLDRVNATPSATNDTHSIQRS